MSADVERSEHTARNDAGGQDQGGDPRSLPEWVTFAVASALVVALVAVLAAQLAGPTEPARPTARVAGTPTEHRGAFHVPVEIINRGDRTAASVQVVAELTAGGDVSESEQIVDFLAGGERTTVVFVFLRDPSDGELEVAVRAFAEP